MFRSAPVRLAAALVALALVAAACGDDATSTTQQVDTTATSAPSGGGGEGRVVEAGDAISVHYTGTLDDGEVFDSSRDRGTTLDFTVGAGQMIAGFDAAVVGMAVGETKTVRIEPAEAYGERREDLLVEVGLEQVPEGVEVGQQLFDNRGNSVTVVEIRDDVVVIDQNHRLAGQALTFEIELVSIN